MIVVLDVSAAIEIVLKKARRGLFNAAYQEAEWVIAPDLFVSEIANVFWKYHRAKLISHESCIQYVEDAIDLIDDTLPVKDLWRESISEATKNNHSAYDMTYAILSRRNNATLLTNDKSLSKICKKLRIDVVI